MDAENDVQEALKSLQALAPTHFSHQPSKIINDNPVHGQTAPVTQLARAEEDLMANVRELKRCNQIFGGLPTIDKLVNPHEENKDINSPYKFNKTNDTDAEIIMEVQHQMAVKAGEIIEVDLDSDSDSDKEDLSMHEIIQLCKCLEKACIKHSRASSSLDLPQQLWSFMPL